MAARVLGRSREALNAYSSVKFWKRLSWLIYTDGLLNYIIYKLYPYFPYLM
jgi:hypothetical protein